MTQLLTRPAPVPSDRYQAYTSHNYRDIPQVRRLSEAQRRAIDVVSQVLPFKTNNYVIDQLIDWDAVPTDPMFVLNFPQEGMLRPADFARMAALIDSGAPRDAVRAAADEIRLSLNPHPAGQMEHNVPELDGVRLSGLQHKYPETVLFFPSNGQTCHAYCTFCFRWPQFVGMDGLQFAMREVSLLVAYLRRHPEVTNVLFTGGDPMVMRTDRLAAYVDAILEARIPHLTTIRFGTKSLGYWPYRFMGEDGEQLLALFRRIRAAGLHVAVMAHFNHPRELSTPAVREAIERIRETGAQVRTQSPVMRNINDDPAAWRDMWREQVRLGAIPYYMFVARDTGAKHYFEVPLVRAWEIFHQAYQQVSGLARTVRGPSMSCEPGKVAVLGPATVRGERVLTLMLLQGRNPDWVTRPFFAAYDEQATWMDELRPAFGETRFFFEPDPQAEDAALDE
ncbi:MAG: lysine 2,3-aminomutase [Dehalococcoidia bacterium]|nr:lysine 2,3-aminomutase [Dehalococcoidia bacterium]